MPVEALNAYWAGDYVVIVSRQQGVVRRFKEPADYCCFLLLSEVDAEAENKIRKHPFVRGMRVEGEYWRVQWKNWKIMRKVCDREGPFHRAGITPFEADVNPVRRWLTDNDVLIQKPRRVYLDFEADSRKPIPEQINGNARLLCWSLIDDQGESVAGCLEADTDEAEIELWLDLIEELKEYDQIIAWGGDTYDFPLIKNRCEYLDVKADWRRWLWLDHLGVFKRMNITSSESGDEKQSFALDRIAHALVGEGKSPVDASKAWEYWEAGGERREMLVEYNVNDVDLMRRIEVVTGYLDLQFTVCETCNTFPDSHGTNALSFVEGYLLKLGAEKQQRAPTKYEPDGKVAFEGALVLKPAKGIQKGVHVADFSGLYPSIIITWNISPETWNRTWVEKENTDLRPSYLKNSPVRTFELPAGHCKTPNGLAFRSDVTGFLPEALIELTKLRNAWKKKKAAATPGTPEWKEADRRSTAYKIAANSFYGVVGSVFSRYFVREAAESVTLSGQWLLKTTLDAAERRGFNVIYGDTDSIFVSGLTDDEFAEFVDWCNSSLYPSELEKMNAPTNRISLGYEKKFDRIVFTNKKRYAGRYEHFERTPAVYQGERNWSKPEVKGFEYKRGDTLRMTRDMQSEAIELLLGIPIDGRQSFDVHEGCDDRQQFLELVRRWRDRILEGGHSLESIQLSKSLTKHPEKYVRKRKKDGSLSSLPAHVEVAIDMLKSGRSVFIGSKIPYIVKDASVTPMVAIPADQYDGENADLFYLWENLVFPATQRLLEAAFPGPEWKAFLKVRPPKKRGRGHWVPPEQGSLF